MLVYRFVLRDESRESLAVDARHIAEGLVVDRLSLGPGVRWTIVPRATCRWSALLSKRDTSAAASPWTR